MKIPKLPERVLLKKILLINLLFLLIFSDLSAQNRLFNSQNRLNFADHLFCEKDYLRAFNEYREYLKYEFNDTVIFKVSASLAQMGRFTESNDYYKTLFSSLRLSEEAKCEFYRNLFLSNRLKDFKYFYETTSFIPLDKDIYLKRMLISSDLINMNKYSINLEDLISAFPKRAEDSLKTFYNRLRFPKEKSPLTAGLLSTLIPGLGKIYTEEYGDGISSLLLTGILAYLAIDNFGADHNFRGWLFTGFAAYFYAGNVYGSISSAHQFNANLRLSLDSDIKLFFSKNNYFLPKTKFVCD